MEPQLKDEYEVVWDLETTGFDGKTDVITEIGCFIVRGDEIERKHWVLDNGIPIPERITEITGITNEIIAAEGRDPKECLNEFLPILKGAKMNTTHNGVKFDIPFLTDYAAKLLGWEEKQREAAVWVLKSTAFDTAVHFKAKMLDERKKQTETFMVFAQRVMNIRAFGVKFNLGACCDLMKVDRSNLVQHRAMADVELTHLLSKTIEIKAFGHNTGYEGVVETKEELPF